MFNSYYDASPPAQACVKRRFLEGFRPGKSNECWEWEGGARSNGYGQLWMRLPTGKTMIGTHRLAYELRWGPTRGRQVLHQCDNPGCVNPYHLFLGTPADNMRDKAAKGRGGYTGNKLTAEQRREIRARLQEGAERKALAAEYGVSVPAIAYYAKRLRAESEAS